jgi:hypothetical protein
MSPTARGREKDAPRSVAAERAVLGAILTDAARLLDALTPAEFSVDGHRQIFEALRATHAAGQVIDLLTVSERLHEQQGLAVVEARERLASLVEEAATHVNALSYVRILRDHAVRRAAIELGARLRAQGHASSDGVGPWLAEAAATIAQLQARTASADPADAAAPDPWADGRALYTRPPRTYTHLIQGIIPAAGLVLGTGEDKAGKSTLGALLVLCYLYGLPFLGHAVPRAGRVVIVSEEDDGDELRDRLRALHAALAAQHPDRVRPPDDPATLA